jgi:hypothetical protein
MGAVKSFKVYCPRYSFKAKSSVNFRLQVCFVSHQKVLVKWTSCLEERKRNFICLEMHVVLEEYVFLFSSRRMHISYFFTILIYSMHAPLISPMYFPFLLVVW